MNTQERAEASTEPLVGESSSDRASLHLTADETLSTPMDSCEHIDTLRTHIDLTLDRMDIRDDTMLPVRRRRVRLTRDRPTGSTGSRQRGNTNGPVTRAPPAVHWLFTFNNYSNEELKTFINEAVLVKAQYLFQEELGTEGTPHLQGYVRFRPKKRPMSVFSSRRIHWEVCRDHKDVITYVTKEDTRVGGIYSNFWVYIPPLFLIKEADMYPWQKQVITLIGPPTQNSMIPLYEPIDLGRTPEDRLVYWFWDTLGNVGKTALSRFICHYYGAIIVSGKANDMKYGIVKYFEDEGRYPSIIICDIPRESARYINYAAIENIKDGCFFVGKYESRMVLMNSPTIIMLANFHPPLSVYSADRWRVAEIINKEREVAFDGH